MTDLFIRENQKCNLGSLGHPLKISKQIAEAFMIDFLVVTVLPPICRVL